MQPVTVNIKYDSKINNLFLKEIVHVNKPIKS